jgi:hypothetical protein
MFEQAAAHVVTVLEADEIIGQFTVLRNTTDRYDDRLKHALRTDGICLVVVALAGNLEASDEPLLRIRHEIAVAVIANPAANQSGQTLLGLVERVLKIVHQSKPAPGLRNAIVADQPAYENANIDAGPQAYVCNFRYKTIT